MQRRNWVQATSEFTGNNSGTWPIPVAAQSKAWGSNPTGGHGCLSVVSVVCCQVEVSATS